MTSMMGLPRILGSFGVYSSEPFLLLTRVEQWWYDPFHNWGVVMIFVNSGPIGYDKFRVKND